MKCKIWIIVTVIYVLDLNMVVSTRILEKVKHSMKLEIKKKMMKFLNRELYIKAYSYYELDDPVSSDAEYDQQYKTLVKLEEDTGLRLDNSITQIVGAPKINRNNLSLNMDMTKFIEIDYQISLFGGDNG